MNRNRTRMHMTSLIAAIAALLHLGCATWRAEDKAEYMRTDPMGRTEVPRY